MELSTLPPATALLAVELQLADVTSIMQGLDSGDEYVAFQAMQSVLQETLLLLQDRIKAMEVLSTDHENRVVFERLSNEERQAKQDHNLACELGGVGSDHLSREDQVESRPPHDDAWLDNDCQPLLGAVASACRTERIFTSPEVNSSSFYAHDDVKFLGLADDVTAANAESSIRAQSKGKRKADQALSDEYVTHVSCSACLDLYPRFDVLELTCKRAEEDNFHAYCRVCLVDHIQTSLTDVTLFPPRCCGKSIPPTLCRDLCPPKLVQQYREKIVELESPNPMYCSNRCCVKFLKPENVTANIAVCPVCKSETCAICKNPKHNGVCPDDPEVKLLMDVAAEKKWQRCHQCRALVELLEGCYHMSCPCGAQFCYICAKPWKTCSCNRWDENRLLSGDPGAENTGHRIAMPEEEETQEVDPSLDILNDMQLRIATVAGGFSNESALAELIGEPGPASGTCNHRWNRTYGKDGKLEVCGICHYHLKFVNACTNCKTRVCNRCLNNRL